MSANPSKISRSSRFAVVTLTPEELLVFVDYIEAHGKAKLVAGLFRAAIAAGMVPVAPASKSAKVTALQAEVAALKAQLAAK